MFLSFDGVDGAGKSTQVKLLSAWLGERGHQVVLCRDPGSTPLGEKIRSLLLSHNESMPLSRRAEMLLYMAARAQLVDELISPALARGKTVISDRYLLANVVYQGHAGGLGVETLWNVGKIATADILPDLVFLLDMGEDEAMDRISRPPDRMESHDDQFRQRLRAGFLIEAHRHVDHVVVLDANRSIEAVYADVCTHMERFLAQQD